MNGDVGKHSFEFSLDGTVAKKGYTYSYSFIQLFYGGAVFFMIFPIIWLVILPFFYNKLFTFWANRSTSNKFILTLNKIFGPVAAQWIELIDSNKATLWDYNDKSQYNLLTKSLSFFFWQFTKTMYQFGQISPKHFVIFVIFGAIPCCYPLLYTYDTGASFAYGAIHNMFVPYWIANLMGIAYYVLYSFCLCVLCDINNRKRRGNYREIKVFSKYSIVIFTLSVIGFGVYTFLVLSLFPPYSYFLSPFTIMTICMWAIVIYEGFKAKRFPSTSNETQSFLVKDKSSEIELLNNA